MIWIVLGALLIIIVQYFIADEMRDIAISKGCLVPGRYFWFSFLFGLPGWIMVVALPNKTLEKKMEEICCDKQSKNRRESVEPRAVESNIAIPHTVDRSKNMKDMSCVIAHKLPDGRIKCPICGFSQSSSRKVCWDCGAEFVEEALK